MAYVLGYFAADGAMIKNNRGAHFIEFSSTDEYLIKSVREMIGSNHTISKRIKKKKHWKQVYRLQIGSKDIFEDLVKLGFSQNKSLVMSLPDIPSKYFGDFVRGYFDGDGNVWVGYVHKERKKPLLAIRVDFTSCSALFLETLKLRLEYVNINRGVLSETNSNCHRLRYSIHNSLRLYNFMYNQGVCIPKSLLLLRKKKIFEKYIHMRV